MGGPGSGRRWHYGARETTDDYLTFDVRRLHRDGLLSPGRSFTLTWSRRGMRVAAIEMRSASDRVMLSYRHRSKQADWQVVEYPVYLDWTNCHLGGQRPWFLCPAHGCGKRVAIIYFGERFACRHCRQLAYASQRESDLDLSARRVDRIREKLGWKPGIFSPRGEKPKGMHWSTYWRLYAELDEHQEVSLSGLITRFNLFGSDGSEQ